MNFIKKTVCVFLYYALSLVFVACQGDDTSGESKPKLIVCTWGDSLTAGAGGDGTTYPNVLQSLFGVDFQVINCGVGGEGSLTVAGRQGGIPMQLARSVELPADNSAVIIGDRDHSFVSSWNGRPVGPLLQGGEASVNYCVIDEIECTLRWTGSAWDDAAGRYTLQRVIAGHAPVTLHEKSIVFTSSMRQYRSQFANVFFIGQNGSYATNADLVAQYNAVIDFSLCQKFVILGLTSGTAAERADLETLMTEEFGAHYINLREYLATSGLQDADMIPTQADTEAMSEGKVPPSLLSDHVHFNAKGYESIGKLIYKRFRYLGII
ncbi:hypothetical protein SAMD00024442_6_95 [Candidatus Symbiothrix dinenymphae]|nr:hypothetical protein SAMD00024442_6_95 [Candidatus Symbiothrix dinenymphae]